MLKPQTVVFVFVPSDANPSISARPSPQSQPPTPPTLSAKKPKTSYVAEKLLLLAFALLIALGIGVSVNPLPHKPSPANPPPGLEKPSDQMPPGPTVGATR